MKEIISQLLTYSSFEDFSHMMHRAYENMDDNPRIKRDILEVRVSAAMLIATLWRRTVSCIMELRSPFACNV